MFRFQNIKQKFGRYSLFGDYVNNFQILNLKKHEIFPYFEKEIIKNVPTNLIINSGKLMINMKKFNKNKILKQKTLFAEKDILHETEGDDDIILTKQKYVLTIAPNVFYSFYSYDDNTNFQLLYKSDISFRYYIYQKNNKYLIDQN